LAQHRYLLALGSNIRHRRYGRPAQVVRAAIDALEGNDMVVEQASPIFDTAPLGHSRRRFANAAAIIRSEAEPPELLAHLKHVERKFGRRRAGRRWAERVLDIDIVLWEGGCWVSDGLVVPHVAFREREFVLRPAAAIAPDWRDPVSGLAVSHLFARLTRPRPVPR